MSCKLTYNGKRFDTTEQLKEYVKTLPLSEQKRINSSDNLEFINARSKYQDELLEKFDPQTLLEISQSIGSRVSFIIDALCAKNTYKGMNRDTAIRAMGKDKIFQGTFQAMGNSFFNILYDISSFKRTLDSKTIKIIKNYAQLFSIPINKILEEDENKDIRIVMALQSTLNNLQSQPQYQFDGKPNVNVMINADQNNQYGDIIQLMANLQQAGIQKVGLLTAPPKPASK